MHVALLIDDAQLAAASESFVRNQIDRYDQLYDGLATFLDAEPCGDGLLRIAVLPTGQAGLGYLGCKGIEVTHAFFDDPGQRDRDLLYEVVKHEMIHNFDLYSDVLFTSPDPAHSWTDFMQPYLGHYLREGFTDQSLVSPDDWLRIVTDRFFGPYLAIPNRSWTRCVQAQSCDGSGMAQHAQGGFALRVAQLYGPQAMKTWYPRVQDIVAERGWSSSGMSEGDKVDLLFESLSKAVGEDLSCFADTIQWPVSASLRARVSALPRSRHCEDRDRDGYTRVEGDLADDNINVYPGAPESPDGLDNDLNGAVDETSVSDTSPFPHQIENSLSVPWPVRITGTLENAWPGNIHHFKLTVASTVNLRFQLRNTNAFNGSVQVYNPDGTGYSSQYTHDLSAITDLTLALTPGEWRFAVVFGASGGPGTYELVVAQAQSRVDPVLFVSPPAGLPNGQLRLSAPRVAPEVLSRSDRARFWVSGSGWVGSAAVQGVAAPSFDWTPPVGDLARLRYGMQFFLGDVPSSAMSPAVPLQTSPCTFAVSPGTVQVPRDGGVTTLTITTSVGCQWQPASDVTWLAVHATSGAKGNNSGNGRPNHWWSGSGTVSIHASANTGFDRRSGSIAIGGQADVHAVFEQSPAAPGDEDGLPDDWELRFGLNPYVATGVDGDAGDPDQDGRTNLQEYQEGTHPRGFFTRYFAEGATGTFFDTRLALLNVGVAAAHVQVRFLEGDGSVVSHGLTVGGLARATVNVKDVPGMATAEFSTVIESDQELVADRVMSWDGTGYGSHAESSVLAPARTWYFAEGATHSGFNLFYLIQNPGSQPVDVEITYLLPAPRAPITRTYSFGPYSRGNVWVDAEGPELADADVSARIVGSLPIIVERAMYLDQAGKTFGAGHESAGVTSLATEWFLAEGATGDYFDCFVLIANPGDTDAEITATFLLPDGGSVVEHYTAAANSRMNIWVDTEDARLANTAVSTIITSTNGVPIIVERSMWWPGPSAATWAEAHNSFGSTTTGKKWALAEGEVGGVRGAETYILIANRGPADAARVTLHYEDGTVEDKDRARWLRAAVRTSPSRPSSRGRRAGGSAPSSRRWVTAPQIAVERAMYSNAGGVAWAAGTNAVATKLQ